jgi:putative ABC transport system substrate-binding protein
MRRREFIAGLGAVAWPLAARGQQADRVRRVGILFGDSPVEATDLFVKTFVEGLAQLGWTEGRNLRIDERLAGSNDPDAIRPHAEALVRAAPDVIFAGAATAVQVVQQRAVMAAPVHSCRGPMKGGEA